MRQLALSGNVLDAESQATGMSLAEPGDRGVVRVDHQKRGGVEALDHQVPVLGQRFQLAVTVELVPEEIHQDDGSGSELPRDGGKSGLIDLEQAHVRIVALQQSCRDAAHEVGAGRVADQPMARRAQTRGEHPRGRGLAVGRRDQDAARRESTGECAGRPRLDPEQEIAGETGPAPASQAAGEAAGGTGESYDTGAHR